MSIQSSRLEACHRVQLGVYSRACSGVCWRAFCECTVKQAGSVPSSAIGSVLESVLRASEHAIKCIWQFC